MRLQSKRIYDNKNRLIYELHNDTDETINNYDNNSNLIYSKNYNIKTGEIFYEFSQEFDYSNRLVHLKDIEYGVDVKYIYDLNSNMVKCITKDKDGIDIRFIEKDKIYVNKVEKPKILYETIDNFGNKSLYEYDSCDNVSKIIDLNKNGDPILEIDYVNEYKE